MSNSRTSDRNGPSGQIGRIDKMHKQLAKPKEASPKKEIPCVAVPDKAVGDYVMVAILTPKGEKRTIVLHHPIGMTKLDPMSWILSDHQDVSYLTGRTGEDKRATWINMTHERALRAFIRENKDAGLSLVDKTIVYSTSKNIREVELAKARKIHSSLQKVPGGHEGLQGRLYTHLPEESDRVDEEKFLQGKAALEELVKAERKRTPFDFETKSGVLSDKPQVSAPGFDKIHTSGALVDTIVNGLNELSSRGRTGSSTSGSTVGSPTRR